MLARGSHVVNVRVSVRAQSMLARAVPFNYYGGRFQ
jgi:hypothetical protein